MVSKAREDLPDPERPVMTVRVLRGISTLIFLRLCWRAPRTTSFVRPMIPKRSLHRSLACDRQALAPSGYTEASITLHDSRGALAGSTRRRGAEQNKPPGTYSESCRGVGGRGNFGGGGAAFSRVWGAICWNGRILGWPSG